MENGIRRHINAGYQYTFALTGFQKRGRRLSDRFYDQDELHRRNENDAYYHGAHLLVCQQGIRHLSLNGMERKPGSERPFEGNSLCISSLFGGTAIRRELPKALRIVTGLICALIAISRNFLGVHTPLHRSAELLRPQSYSFAAVEKRHSGGGRHSYILFPPDVLRCFSLSLVRHACYNHKYERRSAERRQLFP